MPYALPDPNAPFHPEESASGLASPASREVSETLREMQEVAALPDLEREIRELRAFITLQAAEAEREAEDAVGAAPEIRLLRGAGPGLRELWEAHAVGMQSIRADLNLSAKGRNDAEARALERLDSGIRRIADRVLSQEGDALLARFPAPAFGAMGADVSAEATMHYAAFGAKLATTFAAESISLLRRAATADATAAERYRTNVLLFHVFGPLNERRAAAPERHAQGLAPLSAELARMIRLHLDTVLQAARHRIALERAERCRSEYTFLVHMSRELGRWDEALEVGAPAFAW